MNTAIEMNYIQLIKVCINTEIKLKSSTTDKQMEMELMLFKTFMIK